MKTKFTQIIITLLFLVISPHISSAEVNKEVLFQWIRASVDVAEITDQALDDLLNQPALVTLNAYEPLPESYYTVFGAIFAAESIGTKLGNNDYLGAMSEAESLILTNALSETFASSLYSTYSVASITASLIDLYLHCFADQLVANAIQDQINLYKKARTMGYSHEFILSGQDDDTVFFMPNGWLLMVDYERANLNPTFGDLTSAQVFTENALLAYQASLAASGVGKEKQEVGAIFTSLIKPGITITPAYPTAPVDLRFEATGRMIEAMNIVSYHWNFGDSTTATGNAVTHYYKTPGTFQVVLTLTDNGGMEHVYNKSVKIGNPPVQIDFPDGCASSTRQFSTANSSHIAEYRWNFGDSTPEVTGRVQTHDYVNRQSYLVTLKVKLDDNTLLQNTGYVFTQSSERSVASHTISGLEEWCGASTYIMEGSLYVAAGATLKIAPNTLVKLKPGAGINVSGTLIADQVTFTWATEGSTWRGIEFWGSGASGSKLTNCIIEHGSACTTVYQSSYLISHGLISVFNGANPEIKGCTVTGDGSSTGLWVGGSGSSPAIAGNSINGFATGIYIGNTFGVTGLAIGTVINNTISNCSLGLNIASSAGGGTYKFNRLSSNDTGVQINYSTTNISTINDNIFFSNSSNDISATGTIPTGAKVTWQGGNVSYYNSNGLPTVSAGAQLIIKPGAIIKFASARGASVSGTLIADQVTFTWATEGAVWKGIEFWGSGASGSKLTNCIIEHGSTCTTVYQSSYLISHGLISVFNGANPEIKGCTVTGDGSSTGLWVGGSGSSPAIAGNSINGFATGIYIGNTYGVTGLAIGNIVDNIISNNTLGLNIDGTAGGGTYKLNKFSNNTAGIQINYTTTNVPVVYDNTFSSSGSYDFSISGTIPAGATVTWQGGNLTYYNSNGMPSIPTGAKLTIEPGAIIKFAAARGASVSGTLIADQVTFTWATEGVVWKGIEFWNAGSSGSKLTHCIIEHGSACTTVYSYSTLYHGLISVFKGSTPEIKDCVITGSGTSTGIWVGGTGAAPVISGNTISGFATGIYIGDTYVSTGIATADIQFNVIKTNSIGIDLKYICTGGKYINNVIMDNSSFGFRYSGNSIINAVNNYWGAESGPLDDSNDTASGGWYNPAGTGNKVSNKVKYLPWGNTNLSLDNPDEDNDGITDWLEVQFSLNPNGPDASTQDDDHDGYSNYQECVNWVNGELDPNGQEFHPLLVNGPNGTGYVSLDNVMYILQILTGQSPSEPGTTVLDFNSDKKLGLEETIRSLKQLSKN